MNDLERARRHFMAALEAQQAGRLAEAEAGYRLADSLVPGRVSVMTNLAAVLIEQRRFAEGRDWCEKVLAADSANVEGLLNLARCHVEAGESSQALQLLDHALENSPTHVGVLAAKGATLLHLGRPRDALGCFRLALRHAPHSPAAEEGFVMTLRSGLLVGADHDQEVETHALRLFRSSRFRPESIAHVLRGRVHTSPKLGPLLARVEAAWPERLPPHALDVSPSVQPAPWDDPVLIALLATTPITDIAIECLLVTLRRHLLLQVDSEAGGQEFHCALARQCFINEYVYPCLPDETQAVDALRQRLEKSIASNNYIPDAWLAAIAAYVPLHSLADAGRLVGNGSRSPPVEALLTQQLREPMAEAALRSAIERLTPIDDAVSLKVRQQYEENPYPRWTIPALSARRSPLAEWLEARTGYAGLEVGATADILIAGCGTGRQVLEFASEIADANVLAVDLSLSSLAFGMRKAREIGLAGIRFAQADILRLDALERRFDYIDSSGVLHHLGDPAAGLAVLCRLLKDSGVIRLGLYSEAARSGVVAMRQRIAESGATADAESIRRVRQQLVLLPRGAKEREVVRFADFYSTSECRDLLFHVQEHRYSIQGLARLLDAAGLRFIGFDLEATSLARFSAAYPGRKALADLELWAEFERRNPDFFASMYQFWACKKDPGDRNP